MVVRKVSSQGAKMRVIYLPTTDFKRGDRVKLKPQLRKNYIITKVVSMGARHIGVVIPKIHWDYFPHRWKVSIRKIEKGE